MRSLTFLLQNYEKSFEEHASGLLFSTFCAKNFAMFSESDTFAVEITNINLLMKGFIATLLLAFASTAVFAQRNPVPGYIITNENDTIYGTLDYLSDEENCRSCFFKRNGSEEFHCLFPKELNGYRFSNNGAYYITRTFDVEGSERTMFAEYLIKGGVSLYRLTTDKRSYFYFEGEDGKITAISADATKAVSNEYEAQHGPYWDRYRQLYPIFYKDPQTLDKLRNAPRDAETLTAIVKNYDELFCTDAGECVKFLYDEKKTRKFQARFLAEAGWVFGSYKSDDYKDPNTHTFKVAIGVEMNSKRLAPALFYHLKVGYSHWSVSGRNDDGQYRTETYELVQANLGLSYHFLHKKKSTPYLIAGICLPYFGVYGGIGYEMSILKSSKLQFSVLGSWNTGWSGDSNISYVNANIGFVL